MSISSLAVHGGPQTIRMATHSFNSANPGRDPANKTSVSTVNDPNHVHMSSANIKQSGLFDSCGVNKESPGVLIAIPDAAKTLQRRQTAILDMIKGGTLKSDTRWSGDAA